MNELYRERVLELSLNESFLFLEERGKKKGKAMIQAV
jgi:hypothetical protein